jgi:hypothetical protein
MNSLFEKVQLSGGKSLEVAIQVAPLGFSAKHANP